MIRGAWVGTAGGVLQPASSISAPRAIETGHNPNNARRGKSDKASEVRTHLMEGRTEEKPTSATPARLILPAWVQRLRRLVHHSLCDGGSSALHIRRPLMTFCTDVPFICWRSRREQQRRGVAKDGTLIFHFPAPYSSSSSIIAAYANAREPSSRGVCPSCGKGYRNPLAPLSDCGPKTPSTCLPAIAGVTGSFSP